VNDLMKGGGKSIPLHLKGTMLGQKIEQEIKRQKTVQVRYYSCYHTLQHTATHCNTQYTATHCNTLQHTATHNTEDRAGTLLQLSS